MDQEHHHTTDRIMEHPDSHHGGAHHSHDDHDAMIEDFRRRFRFSLALTIPILLLSPMLQMWAGLHEALRFPGDTWVLFALSTGIFLYGGRPFLRGFVEEWKKRNPGMMTLVAVAITTAFAYSAATVFGLEGEGVFWELATLIDLMLLGHWIEMRSIMGASRALKSLATLMPSDAHVVLPDGSTEDRSLDHLREGDRVLVRPGEKVSADGTVLDGTTTVDESMLTGESKPVLKVVGDDVIGGSINGEGSVIIEVMKTGEGSFLARVIELVRQAQESKSRAQDLANRAARWLTLTAIAGGLLTLIVWLLIPGVTPAFAIERGVTVMVISCPHALGLAVPLVVAVSTTLAARSGLLIRNRAAFERARRTDAVIFDKTGTLTEGKFSVVDVVPYDGVTHDLLLRLAASVEIHSQHPIAVAIAAASSDLLPVRDFRSITGKGAEGVVEGRRVVVASPGHVRARGVDPGDRTVRELRAGGRTVVVVLSDDRAIGAISLADVPRPESREAVSRLKEMGIRSMMMTGDNRDVARDVAEKVGLDEYFAEVLPDGKGEMVREIQSRGLVVAMTGDGVNDAPALAQADVAIAIGAGTDVAIETADVILVRSNPIDVASAIDLARLTYRKTVQNLWWATGYNLLAMPLAAGVLSSYGIVLSPAVGAVLMSLSTIIVAVNARMMRSSYAS